jgi:hypothetical protein
VKNLNEEINQITETIDFLQQQNYHKTASQIIALLEAVSNLKISSPKEISRNIQSIFNVFKNEFARSMAFGQTYRRRCFEEVQIITLQSFLMQKKRNSGFPQEYSKFIDKMNENDLKIHSATQLMSKMLKDHNRSSSESQVVFDLACHTYLISIEGIFPELVKLLYALMSLSIGKVLEASDLDSKSVWAIYRKCEEKFGIKPVFLEKWYEKNAIRNAIAHAQAQYDPVLDMAHFFAIDSVTDQVFDKSMSFAQFFTIWMELADAEDSFRYAIRLTNVFMNLIVEYTRRSTRSS